MPGNPPALFISYSHDSVDHSARVLRLADRLRGHGIDVELDQYETQPSEGWPHWCEERLRPENADFVLVICTRTYLDRVERRVSPDEGRGVYWEGTILYNYLYSEKGNDRFLLVLLDGESEDVIPVPLKGYTRYRIDDFELSDAGYEDLYRTLTDQPRARKPGLGKRVELGTRGPGTRTATASGEDLQLANSLQQQNTRTLFNQKNIAPSKLPSGAELLIGREEESAELDRALKSADTHIIEFVAWAGIGKSALVVDWMTRLSQGHWTGIDRYFDWSFYSQGTRDQSAVSADQFIAQALTFFGDPDPQLGSPHDRGTRLAELVAEQPTVLILDGVEPLQYGTGSLRGQLKDPAVLALLKGLAQRPFVGLCAITTREELTDLSSFHRKTVVHYSLQHLSESAGAALLHRSGATRRGAANIAADDEALRATSREVNGHALTLRLLGGYLKLAHEGDIERRDRVQFEKADAETQGGHAFRTIAAYEHWLRAEVPDGRGGDAQRGPRQLAILRLLGLFDRPASADCLKALRREPAITGLTEQLVGLEEDDWNIAVTSLVELDLISSQGGTLDAHPLLREYFAVQLRDETSESRTEGHRRLFEHLCESTEHRPDGIEGLQPLYQAVAHGCQAGLHEQAWVDVYINRILRGTGSDGNYSTSKLGAIGANLGAVACFFDRPWRLISPKLSDVAQSWLLNEAAYCLRAVGRLTEALEPMRAALKMVVERDAWTNAARAAGNLSELELTLGELSDAIADAEQSVTFADRSKDQFSQLTNRTTHGDALHQADRHDEAGRLFAEAETISKNRLPQLPWLYSIAGYRYCDLLLSGPERIVWRLWLKFSLPSAADSLPPTDGKLESEFRETYDHATERATQTLERAMRMEAPLLTIALDHLTLARAALYRWLANDLDPKVEGGHPTTLGPCPSAVNQHLTAAVDGIRESGNVDYLTRGLLTRAWHHHSTANPSAAVSDLDEAWDIAARGPMPLFQADILLTRARLFFRDDFDTAEQDLTEARRLIDKHGYHRRDEELEDAETALVIWKRNASSLD